MGFYIETPEGNHNKAENIVKAWGGERVDSPPSFAELESEGKVLITVNNQGMFEAAGICYSEAETKAFDQPTAISTKFVVLTKEAAVKALAQHAPGMVKHLREKLGMEAEAEAEV